MPPLPFPPALLVPLVLATLVAAGLLLRRAVGPEALYRTIVEAETRPARLFDAVLLAAIGLSVLTVILESDSEVGAFYWTVLAPDIVNLGREEQG
jgi:hypothetical protein